MAALYIVPLLLCFNPQARESLILMLLSPFLHCSCFNPQARESLIAEASANPSAIDCFNPQARESLIRIFVSCVQEPSKFQSAGSREPDLAVVQTVQVALLVSIRRLARA